MSPAATLRLLAEGEIEVVGRLPSSSNETLLVEVRAGAESAPAVYKHAAGERPLRDFPPGLHLREVAAFELSEWLGWGLVPPTILRLDAPLGPGSLQSFVPADRSQHYFTLFDDERLHHQLMRICTFDLLANSADRKSGHCLLGPGGRVWAIDNGLTFHHQLKLRTVIWEFAGQPVPRGLLADVERLGSEGPPGALFELLTAVEVEALLRRAADLLEHRCFPADISGHRYPWPLV